jgi:hypothetical protein
MKRFSITVPDEIHNWLTDQSLKRGLSMNAVVILALEQYKEAALSVSQLEELKSYLQSSNLDD